MENKNRNKEKQKNEMENKKCLSPGSDWGPLVCETNVITNYTTQTSYLSRGLV